MKRIIVIPDSYKGSLSSAEVCSVIQRAILDELPQCEVICIPVADGGEGTTDAFLTALGGEKIPCKCSGPLGKPVQTYYGGFDRFAVLEMASCAGLTLLEEKAPLDASTFGVGEQILHALQRGYRKLIIGIGGSATTDGGCGMASALGVKFFDDHGNSFSPTGRSLKNIKSIDISTINPLVKEAEFITMCDISNPLYGKNGAAYIFGPQKGADPDTVRFLDEGLCHLAKIIERDLGTDISHIPGGGAAGGLGAGLYAFLQSKIQMGIDTVLEYTDFRSKAQNADLVITGEGRLDHQTLSGKVACGVGKASSALGIPAIAIVGSVEPGFHNFSDLGLTAVFDTVTAPMSLEEALPYTEENIAATVRSILHLYRAYHPHH